MAKKTSLTMNVRIDGARETLAAFRRLPKEASHQVRERSMKLAQELVGKVQAAAMADQSPQAALLVSTVKARRDRVPAIAAGGSKRVGRRRVPAYQLLFGAEFGSNQFRQFGKSHQGKQGSWLFSVAEENQELISREWNEAADEIARDWSDRGGV